MVTLYHLSDPLFFVVIVSFIARKLPDAIDNHLFIRVFFNGVTQYIQRIYWTLAWGNNRSKGYVMVSDSIRWLFSLASGQTTGRELSPTHQQEIGHPLEQDPDPPQPVSPIGKPLQASYHYPSEDKQNGNHNYRKLTKMITCITALSNSRNYEPCLLGSLKMDGSWGRVLTKHGPLEKGMSNHFSILGLRPHEQYGKAKR